jgi:HlyD family secretion protein
LLIRLDDNEAQARISSVQLQARALREARDRVTSPRHQQRRRAEDSVWDAEQELATVRAILDRAIAARPAADVPADEIAAARRAVTEAEDSLLRARDALGTILRDKATPPSEAADAALAAARAQARLAEAELEATRIRAPVAGTVLAVNVKAGEVVRPEGEALAVVGDLDLVRVRAELDLADSGRVSVGQRAVMLDDAGGMLAEGTVASIAPVLTASRLRDPKNDIRAVTVMLERPPGLPVGRRVAVRFIAGGSSAAQSAR